MSSLAPYGFLPQIIRGGVGLRVRGSGIIDVDRDDSGTNTIAELSAQPGTAYSRTAYVSEVDASYEWIPGDATAVNGWTVFAGTGGVSGRWLLIGDTLSVAPRGSGLDDWLRLFGPGGIAQAMSYRGRIVLRAGLWTCATSWQLPNGTHIVMSAGVTINSTLVAGTFTQFIFWKWPTLAAITGTLAATPTFGATTVSSTASYPAGSWIWIGQTAATGHLYLSSQYRVISVAGAGPYTLTLDRAVRFPFVLGDEIRIISEQARNIIIEGNGATIRGGGDRGIGIVGGYLSHVKDLNFQKPTSGAAMGAAVSFDIGSLDCTIEGCTCDEGAAYGFMLESAESCDIVAHATSNVGAGAVLYDCVDCIVYEGRGSRFNVGVQLGSNLMTVGCTACLVLGGTYDGGPSGAVTIDYADDCRLIGVNAENVPVGIDTGTNSTNLRLIGCRTARCSTYGVHVRSPGTRIFGHSSYGDLYGIAAFAACDIAESDFHEYTFGVFVDASIPIRSPVNIRGGRFRSTVLGGSNCMRTSGPAIITFDGCRFENAATDAAQSCTVQVGGANSVVIYKGCTAAQSSASNGAYFQTGETFRIEGRNDLSALSFPIVNAGAPGYASFGTVVANGAAAVALAWPDIKVDTDRVVLVRTTDGGTPGPTPRVTLTAGVGFSITATAGDTSTYSYLVTQ